MNQSEPDFCSSFPIVEGNFQFSIFHVHEYFSSSLKDLDSTEEIKPRFNLAALAIELRESLISSIANETRTNYETERSSLTTLHRTRINIFA